MEHIAILGVAITFDLLLGEYPPRLHPVVWMGRVIDWLTDLAPGSGKLRQFFYGLAMLAIVVTLFTVPAWLLDRLFQQTGGFVHVLLGAVLLKPTFSLRALWESVSRVQAALQTECPVGAECPVGDVDTQEAKRSLGRIVSRDVAALTPPLIASAAIESAAENFTDSFVAPLMYYVLLGVPGAVAYRAVNTLDAMVGYRGKYEYLGKASARADDLLNLAPARLGALLLSVSAGLGNGSVMGALRTMWRDNRKTASPNAGWTMSAMAGALGVWLEKPGVYRLGAGFPEPVEGDIPRGLRIVAGGSLLAAALATLVLGVIPVLRA